MPGLSIVKWVRNFEGGVIESGLWFWSIMTEAEGRLVFATFGKCLVIDLIDCSSLILKHVELWTLHHGTLLRQRMCSMNFMPQRCEWHFWLKHINICWYICSDGHCHYLAKVGNGTRSNYSESQGGASKTCSASLLSTELKWVIKLAIQSFYINWVFYVDGKCKMSGELR